MAEQPPVPDSITPAEFFEQLLPSGFAAQAAEGGTVPGDFTIQFRLTGDGGGEWNAAIANGAMQVRRGSADANLTVTLSVADWRDAVLGRNGANLGIILPQNRPGRTANSA